MSNLSRLSSLSVTLLALSVPFSAVAQTNPNPPASADPTQTNPTNQTSPSQTSPSQTSPSQTTPSQTTPSQSTPGQGGAASFSDVSADYWASPFVQALASRSVIVGYPDGSYKPDQPVTRAEFAAMLQKAFPQSPTTRQLPSGGFSDVPSNYWAAAVIQRAYETGFMSGYPGNVFRPNQQIPRAQALVALTSGLSLTASGATADVLTANYNDASSIPTYAIGNVAAATQANLVVDYPDVKTLNPLQPLTRAEAAAILHQALVKQGQLQPLASGTTATQYIVGYAGSGNTAGKPSTDIVSLAAGSSSFTTLTSLLRTAGLADALQQAGPYTVFAPTDEAFAALPKGVLDRLQLPENKDALVKILSYHVVSGQLTASQLTNGSQNTLSGAPVKIRVSSDNSQISVNDAKIIQPNVQASNGEIYPINKVLLPPGFKVSQLQGGGGQSGGGTVRMRPLSYIGAGGNIGLSGSSDLSIGNFAAISKFGLTHNFSLRPSAVIGDNPLVMVPLTIDFSPRRESALGQSFSIAPYIGAGVAIDTRNTDIGAMVTGGVDIPLGRKFTANAAVNAAFVNDTDVGVQLGIGYNF